MNNATLGYRKGLFYFYSDYASRDLAKRAGFGWSKAENCWITPFVDVASRLVARGKNADWDKMLDAVRGKDQKNVESSHAVHDDLPIPKPAGLSDDYKPYQRAGVRFMLEHTSTLLADEMGLGKTIQVLGLINYAYSLGKTLDGVLIVCPAIGKPNWLKEWTKWVVPEYDVHVVYGRKNWRGADVIIMNYELMASYRAQLHDPQWALVVLDEAHYLKNPTAQRTQLVRGSRSDAGIRARRKLGLTGTPIKNRPRELYTTVNYLLPEGWPRFTDYERRYCGWDGMGKSNLDELQYRLRSTIMIRRLKKFVLPQLPPKVKRIIEIEGTSRLPKAAVRRERDLWEKALAEVGVVDETHLTEYEYRKLIMTLKGGGGIAFDEISKVRHETGVAKIPHVIEHLRDAIESSGKVVCFAHHKDVAKGIKEAFGDNAVLVIGDTTPKQREIAQDRFRNDPSVTLFVGNILAAGTVINLTCSTHCVFAECSWVPGDLTQAADRLHRLTTVGSVLVDFLVFPDSIDAWMAQVTVGKDECIEEALDDFDAAELAYVFGG